MKKTIPSFLLLVVSSAYAYGPLDGLDINFNETEPRQYEFCDQMVSSDKNISEAARFNVFKACNYGLDDARRMAERFGGGNGQIEGFHRGYAFGMRQAYENSVTDSRSYAQGQESISSVGAYIEAGLNDGINRGNSEGNTDGASEARVRFSQAVDTNIFPSALIAPIARAYTPMNNAYNSLVPRDLRAVTSVDDIIKNRDERELNQLSLRNFPVYASYDRTTWGEVRQLSWFDLWSENGRYEFERNRYYDSNLALNVWLSRPIDTMPRYQALKNIIVTDINNMPVNLQGVFQSAFKEGYKYYVNFYFAKEFKRAISLGQMQGEAVGTQIGKRIAFGQGLVGAFNKKFEESAKVNYQKSYITSFRNGFASTYEDYAKNSKLEISNLESGSVLELLGLEDDGIIQPGEAVGMKFKVRNVGGIRTDITASLTGDVLDSKEIKNSVNGISSKVIQSDDSVAIIDSRIDSGANARINLKVNNLIANASIYVTKLVKLQRVLSPEVDTTLGVANVSIISRNVSIKETSASVSATLTIDGKIVAETNVGKVAAGQESKITLKSVNLDPLKLLTEGVTAKITLKLGDTVLETSNVTIASSNKTKELISYYTQLINDSGIVPATISKDERRLEVTKMLVAENRSQLQNYKSSGNIWEKNPSATIVGMLRANKQLGQNTTTAMQNFDQIAREMAKDKTILPKFLFFAAKRKAFVKILNDLTISGKVE